MGVEKFISDPVPPCCIVQNNQATKSWCISATTRTVNVQYKNPRDSKNATGGLQNSGVCDDDDDDVIVLTDEQQYGGVKQWRSF